MSTIDILSLLAEVKTEMAEHVPDARTTDEKIADARERLARYGSPRQIDLALAWCSTEDRSLAASRAWSQLRNAARYYLASRLVVAVLASRDLPRHATRKQHAPTVANPACPCAFCARECATLAACAARYIAEQNAKECA